MKKRDFTVIIEKDESGYFVGTVAEIPSCHTQAKTRDTLMKRVKEAIELCLEEYDTDLSSRNFIGVEKLQIA